MTTKEVEKPKSELCLSCVVIVRVKKLYDNMNLGLFVQVFHLQCLSIVHRLSSMYVRNTAPPTCIM